jgi:hypothetical protein
MARVIHHCVVIGLDSKVTQGHSDVIIGPHNTIAGDYNIIQGSHNVVRGRGNIVIGNFCTVEGHDNLIVGSNQKIECSGTNVNMPFQSSVSLKNCTLEVLINTLQQLSCIGDTRDKPKPDSF